MVEGVDGGSISMLAVQVTRPRVDSHSLRQFFCFLASLTETQTICGTLPYMAPEQLLNEKLDARTDIWALGASSTRWQPADALFWAPGRG